MDTTNQSNTAPSIDDSAYNLIKDRLDKQAEQLNSAVNTLNKQRIDEFGQAELSVLGRMRARTENNCVPRDIERIGDTLLFGYNVFIGLKKETHISDVFSLYHLVESDNEYNLEPIAITDSFLGCEKFQRDFRDLYAYYKSARLTQLVKNQNLLLAVFQIGERVSDIKVFRWTIDGDKPEYVDNRGERDYQRPDQHPFEWKRITRENLVEGKYPHFTIEDKFFFDTIGGSVTIKLENNTDSGLGIFEEPVEDENQSLDDGEFYYAKLGALFLLKVRPYGESNWRYYVFNAITETVNRIDSIGQACVPLPEDHGIIFPSGYYLRSGELQEFDEPHQDFQYNNTLHSPNGEDVLFEFYEHTAGHAVLYSYNLINKTLAKPIYCHGSCIFPNGKMVVFREESTSPTKVHPMQVWTTPFYSDEFASKQPIENTPLSKIGNIELIRGISDLFSISRSIQHQQPTVPGYEDLIARCNRVLTNFYWLEQEPTNHLGKQLHEINSTAEIVLDEFEKVAQIRSNAEKALKECAFEVKQFLNSSQIEYWKSIDEFISALNELKTFRGKIASIQEMRYIDKAALESLDNQLADHDKAIMLAATEYLLADNALDSLTNKLQKIETDIFSSKTFTTLAPHLVALDTFAIELDLLNDMVMTLETGDSTKKTAILENVSEIYSQVNQLKARGNNHKSSLTAKETAAEFRAQFMLFSQSVSHALALAKTPEDCDEQATKLAVSLEELESRFSDSDEYLNDILEKREEVTEALQSKKQALVDQRQKRIRNLSAAADRVLQGIQRRIQGFSSVEEFNTYIAADAMIQKFRKLTDDIDELGDGTKAEDFRSKLAALKEGGVRTIRDKAEIYDDGGKLIKLGKHRFSVNTQKPELTIIPHDDSLALHIAGTSFYESLKNESLVDLKEVWNQPLISENNDVYRAEYLAATMFRHAQRGDGFTLDELRQAILDDSLLDQVRTFIEPRYNESYERGIHDHDACEILKTLLSLSETANALIYAPAARALSIQYWLVLDDNQQAQWSSQAKTAGIMHSMFNQSDAITHLATNLGEAITEQVKLTGFEEQLSLSNQAAQYLAHTLMQTPMKFSMRSAAEKPWQDLQQKLLAGHIDINELIENDMPVKDKWLTALHLAKGYCDQAKIEGNIAVELASLLYANNQLSFSFESSPLSEKIDNLMGNHAVIQDQSIELHIDTFFTRLNKFTEEYQPKFKQFHEIKHTLLAKTRSELQMEQFKSKPLSSFVRNQLINDVYLPIIGDNLAKQMGAAGDTKRSDLMGLLLLISPPGYGKTTLMEYVADRLGLIFVKVNCPTLGHSVASLDPAEATNAAAKQELVKLNFALEMSDNVMLYLDDIQHTHPEFLQKFISLCDGSRRVEGVWREQSKTYNMRGKQFCIVMAGNPYTESGDVFQIPDMLANRADIYNLGDVLNGKEKVFAQSYVENCLTSNSVLRPLANRELSELYTFIKIANGVEQAKADLTTDYSTAEINEITAILQKLFVVRDAVLKVNQQYIASAAQADTYREEPPFKLQGSYRNMNKMAEKLSAIMTDEELDAMILDHYVGEAQTLTSGAEENLLKLRELLDCLTPDEQTRWATIKTEYKRSKSMGDGDTGQQVVNQLSRIVSQMEQAGSQPGFEKAINEVRNQLGELSSLIASKELNIEVINQPVPGVNAILTTMANTIETSLLPVIKAMEHKIRLDHDTWSKVKEISEEMKTLAKNSE